MPEILRPTRETPITMPMFARAIQVAWPTVETSVACTVERAACLWAQHIVESGGKHCYGHNFGNVKDSEGDGFDFQYLRGVWEGVSITEARRLCAMKEAVVDPFAPHHAQVGAQALAVLRGGESVILPISNAVNACQRKEAIVDPNPEHQPGRISVVFQPPHPACRFRWYPNLDVAMTAQLSLVKARYGAGWEGMLQGDPEAFAKGLKLRGYFTATAEAYARILRPNWRLYVASSAHRDAGSALAAEGFEPPKPPVERHDLTTTRGIQRALTALGFDPGPVDGEMGKRTKAAVIAFQKRAGLKTDGIVGPVTRSALARALVER